MIKGRGCRAGEWLPMCGGFAARPSSFEINLTWRELPLLAGEWKHATGCSDQDATSCLAAASLYPSRRHESSALLWDLWLLEALLNEDDPNGGRAEISDP